jgi:hypothetical protein
MKQDKFALVVDVKTKPGLEGEYERLKGKCCPGKLAESSRRKSWLQRELKHLVTATFLSLA